MIYNINFIYIYKLESASLVCFTRDGCYGESGGSCYLVGPRRPSRRCAASALDSIELIDWRRELITRPTNERHRARSRRAKEARACGTQRSLCTKLITSHQSRVRIALFNGAPHHFRWPSPSLSVLLRQLLVTDNSTTHVRID